MAFISGAAAAIYLVPLALFRLCCSHIALSEITGGQELTTWMKDPGNVIKYKYEGIQMLQELTEAHVETLDVQNVQKFQKWVDGWFGPCDQFTSIEKDYAAYRSDLAKIQIAPSYDKASCDVVTLASQDNHRK